MCKKAIFVVELGKVIKNTKTMKQEETPPGALKKNGAKV